MKHLKNPHKTSFTLDCKLFFSGLYQVLLKPGRRAGGQKVIAMQEQSLRVAKTDSKLFSFPRLSFQSKITKELSLHWKAELFTIRTQVKIFIIHRDLWKILWQKRYETSLTLGSYIYCTGVERATSCPRVSIDTKLSSSYSRRQTKNV